MIETIYWATPRPSYVKESEPQANPASWPSAKVNQQSEVFGEAKVNRRLYERGEIDSTSYRKRAAEIVLSFYCRAVSAGQSE